MHQKVLLYTTTLPTRLAVERAFQTAGVEPYRVDSSAALTEALKEHWDVVVLDADSSKVPLQKLLELVGSNVELRGTVVLALTGRAQPLPDAGCALVFNRTIRPQTLLGAINRLLLANGKKPMLRASVVLDQNMRRALRVPLLVPVSFRLSKQGAWQEAESLDVSIHGGRIGSAEGLAPGQSIDLRNTLTGEEAVFRVVWIGEEDDRKAVGLEANADNLRFWLPG